MSEYDLFPSSQVIFAHAHTYVFNYEFVLPDDGP